MKTHEINAVFDPDLIDVLKQLEILDELNKGRIKCYICNKTITLENIHSFFPENDEIKFCCTGSICVEKFNKKVL